MKIQAAVLERMGLTPPYSQSRPLQVQDVELADPGPGELLVRIRAAGLCHSDLSVIDGSRPRQLPMLLGHEAAGEVAAIGADVAGFAPGDHVVLVFVPSCGHCPPCLAGRPALCEPAAIANAEGTLLTGERRLSRDGEAVFHHLGVSAFGEYAVVNQGSAVKIDDGLPFEQAALFGCAVVTGAGAVLNTARVPEGASLAVIGLGGVGLNALLAARLAGASRIVVIDRRADKLELATSLGATDVFSADDPQLIENVRDATHGGVEFAFEMAGVLPALEIAWQITRRGGMTITSGLPSPEKRLAVSPVQLVAEERMLRGSYLGSCVPPRDIPKYISLFRRGLYPIDRLQTETISLADINAGFDRLASGEVTRQVIVFP